MILNNNYLENIQQLASAFGDDVESLADASDHVSVSETDFDDRSDS